MNRLILNPEKLPIHSYGNEGPVEPNRLLPDWLRQRFSMQPKWVPEMEDEQLFVNMTFQPASVLIPLVMRGDELHVLLTRRASHLNAHAGQISFPGGRNEAMDGNAFETALRETEEEIGLFRSQLDVIGQLPVHYTISGYAVTPIVGLITSPFKLQFDPQEVEDVFEVPMAFLMNAKNHQRRIFLSEDVEQSRTFYAMHYRDRFIWGVTATMIRNLFHLIRA